MKTLCVLSMYAAAFLFGVFVLNWFIALTWQVHFLMDDKSLYFAAWHAAMAVSTTVFLVTSSIWVLRDSAKPKGCHP